MPPHHPKHREIPAASSLPPTQTEHRIGPMECSLPQHEMLADVRSGHVRYTNPCPLYPQKRTCAVQSGMSALGHSGHRVAYSISSSARSSNGRGTVVPIAFAVLRLITSSYL